MIDVKKCSGYCSFCNELFDNMYCLIVEGVFVGMCQACKQELIEELKGVDI